MEGLVAVDRHSTRDNVLSDMWALLVSVVWVLVNGVELGDSQNGAENLVSHNGHIVVHVGENGGLDEVSLVRAGLGRPFKQEMYSMYPWVLLNWFLSCMDNCRSQREYR